MSKDRVDAVVVGAGPAGIAAAGELARGGAKVVLIDKHTVPGSKACAGGLTQTGFVAAGIDPASPPGHASVFDRLHVYTAWGSCDLSTPDPFLITVDRVAWTRDQLDELGRLNVDIRLGERLVRIDGRTAVTERHQVAFDALVGADGAPSRVRRLLGLKALEKMRSWQIRVDSNLKAPGLHWDAPTVWFHPDLFGSGYAWAFPAKGEIRIGCGALSDVLSRSRLKAAFFSFISRFGLSAGSGPVQTGSIGCCYAGHRFDRVFLAGDAAGMASPLTGEGIAQAIISGREVAQEILDPSFHSRRIPALGARHRKTSRALAPKPMHTALYPIAPIVLRVPLIARETMRRYML